jgi:outer membrane immunogenic protein
MRKFMIGLMAAVTMGVGASAQAADTTAGGDFDWSGFYVGVHGGYVSVKPDFQDTEDPIYDLDPSFSGVVGGGLLGFNIIRDGILFGAEADFGITNAQEDAADSGDNTWNTFDLGWNAHLRLRAGLVMDRATLFVAGGLAMSRLEVDDVDEGFGEDTTTALGWTLGAGVDYALTNSVLIRAEYLYDSFGEQDGEISDQLATDDYVYSVTPTSHTVRAALSYKF